MWSDVDNCVLCAVAVSSTLIEVTQQNHQATRLQLEKVAFCKNISGSIRALGLDVIVGGVQSWQKQSLVTGSVLFRICKDIGFRQPTAAKTLAGWPGHDQSWR